MRGTFLLTATPARPGCAVAGSTSSSSVPPLSKASAYRSGFLSSKLLCMEMETTTGLDLRISSTNTRFVVPGTIRMSNGDIASMSVLISPPIATR